MKFQTFLENKEINIGDRVWAYVGENVKRKGAVRTTFPSGYLDNILCVVKLDRPYIDLKGRTIEEVVVDPGYLKKVDNEGQK